MKDKSKKITITADSLVADIQFQFAACYSFLKIEFFENNSATFFKNEQVDSNRNVGGISTLTTPVTLNIEEERTVAEVEKDCRELIGLCIQLYRKSGNVWNAISLTNNWTLQNQNEAGEFISTEMLKAS